MTAAVTAADTTVTDIFGIGPIAACLILGHTGDIGRFATADRDASYNATAPIEASSGPTVRHRLNQRGNRQLNHAMHIAAIVQVRFGSPYYQRKIAEGKRPKEAMRSLKRRISDNVYRHLIDDAARHRASGPGRTNQGRLFNPARPARTLNAGASERSLPDPNETLRPCHRGRSATRPRTGA